MGATESWLVMGILNKFTHKKSHEEWLAEHPGKQALHMTPSSSSYDAATRERIEREMEEERAKRK